MGEDAFATYPNAMAVSDGVGSSKFISFYLASILALRTVEFLQDDFERKPALSSKSEGSLCVNLVNELSSSIDELSMKFVTLYNEARKKIDPKEDVIDLYNAQIISSTLIACQINEVGPYKNNLQIIQKGNSLMAFFRL